MLLESQLVIEELMASVFVGDTCDIVDFTRIFLFWWARGKHPRHEKLS